MHNIGALVQDPATKSIGTVVKRAETAEAAILSRYPNAAPEFYEVSVTLPSLKSNHKVKDVVIWDISNG